MENIIAEEVLDDEEEEGEAEQENAAAAVGLRRKEEFSPSQPVLLSQKACLMNEALQKKNA